MARFVSSLALHPTNPNILISAGGDDTLRIWNLTTYKCIDKVSFSLDQLKGTAEVQVEIVAPAPGKRTKRKYNKARANKRAKAEAEARSEPAGGAQEGEEEAEAEPAEEVDVEEELEAKCRGKTKTKKLDLAITRMEFVAGPSGKADDGMLILSSVGSSALLAFPTKSLVEQQSSPVQGQLVKLHHPILNFTANTASNLVYVSLDVTMPADATDRSTAIQALSVIEKGLEPVAQQAALQSLNQKCSMEVSEEQPYPSLLALYPDMALLSKDPNEEA